MPSVTVDLRLLEASGIGTYLQNLVPRIVREFAGTSFALLGDPSEMERRGLGGSGVTRIPAAAPIYSLAEQIEMLRRTPAATELFWSPHYNVPLISPGRLLVTIHDALHLARPEFVHGVHRRLYARAMFASVRRRAARVLCVSRFTADEVVRWGGVDPRRIEIVHEGVGTDWFEAVPGDSPHPRPYLLFVGNVKPHKNLVRLVEAFDLLSGEHDLDLVIVGKREGFITGDRRVAERAARLGSRVRFTGFVPDADLRRYVRHAVALVFPSLYEGFGLPALEAMASGCPVLASRAASLPEVCGDAALYFDPLRPDDIAAKIRLLLEDGALRRDLQGKGEERARRFTWERCARETREVIDHVLEKG